MENCTDKLEAFGNYSSSELSGLHCECDSLQGVILENSNMEDSRFVECDFRGANMINTKLSSGDFKFANFKGANLSHSTALSADFRNADFTKAVLIDADLKGADLRNANFTGSDLTGADLHDALLDGAIFDNAIVFKTILDKDYPQSFKDLQILELQRKVEELEAKLSTPEGDT